MGRPTNADSADTHDRILQATLSLIEEQPIKSLSVRDVATRAGVAVSLVNHYFGNKDGLLTACVETMYADLEVAWAETIGTAPNYANPMDFAEAVVRRAFRFAIDHQPTTRLVLSMIMTSTDSALTSKTRMQQHFLTGWSRMIADVFGCTPVEARLVLQTLVFLSGRYGVATKGELATIAGADEKASLEELRALVADHLVLVARGSLGQLMQGDS